MPSDVGRERVIDLLFVLVLVAVLGGVAVYYVVLEKRCEDRGGRVAASTRPGRPGDLCVLPGGRTIELADL